MVRGRPQKLRERITTSISVERQELELLQYKGIELSELVRDAIRDRLAESDLDKLKLKAERLRDSIEFQTRELEYLDLEIRRLEKEQAEIVEVEQELISPVKIPINDPFPGSVFHHMHLEENHNIGIYVPKNLHRSIGHSSISRRNMNDINKVSLLWLCEQDKI